MRKLIYITCIPILAGGIFISSNQILADSINQSTGNNTSQTAQINTSASTVPFTLPMSKTHSSSTSVRIPQLMYYENFQSENPIRYGSLVTEDNNSFARSELGNGGTNPVQSLELNRQSLQFEQGKKYVISFDYKATEPGDYNRLSVEILPDLAPNIIPNDTEGYTWLTPTTEWQTESFEFTSKSTTDAVRISFTGANSIFETFDIDNISIISDN
ncbi:carbohydrate binding domain-containing protein [Lactococcus taiwanensis]|uniref:Carbohydrate binding domain-containing protein n=1 Tax=Lactococcus taiwanensis TaxID=1151742 RepID=A0AA45QR84_9LACT|nr:carbohydrate binding domain-containing protein [Lactococcus taiwanensis]QSE76709.1 carbohydrate binding domain-containing protein [Lactococcus taiwanensis]